MVEARSFLSARGEGMTVLVMTSTLTLSSPSEGEGKVMVEKLHNPLPPRERGSNVENAPSPLSHRGRELE